MHFRFARARFLAAKLLAVVGALAFVGVFVAIVNPPASLRNRWMLPMVYLVATVLSWACAFRVERPRSRGARTGHIVLFEATMPEAVSQTPALTIRGARDAVERFIPRSEFENLFGGWALWAPPVEAIPSLPANPVVRPQPA